MLKILNFTVFGLLQSSAFASSDDCRTWFIQQGVKKGEDCLIECSVAETDMGTFHCPQQCAALCTESPRKRIFLVLSKIYPTLTPAERELVADQPAKMLLAYKINWESEIICLNIFEKSDTNDESDACRHFVGAALLYEKFGQKFSRRVLDAHEQNPRQPQEEKSMDLENNRLGMKTAIDLKEKNKLNETEILKAFQKHLKKGNLVILRPGAARRR